jgi:hypothetical protein
VEARFEVLPEVELGGPVHTKVVRAKLLVGVGGIKSQVRKIMLGDEPRDLLAITWNAVVSTVRYRTTVPFFLLCRRLFKLLSLCLNFALFLPR